MDYEEKNSPMKVASALNEQEQEVATSLQQFLEHPEIYLPSPEFVNGLAQIDDENDTILNHCIKTQNVKAVEQLLKAGADPNQLSRKGVAPISAAAHKGNTDIIQLLLSAGAQVNSINSSGSTALIQASHFGHLEAVKLLLAFKASSDFANSKGTTALMRSSQEGHVEISKCLINADVDVNRKNHEGMNALMLASQRGHADIVYLLVKAGAAMDEQTAQGSTALMLACKRGHEKCAEVLVSMGAEIYMRDRRLRTARDTALKRQHHSLLCWLDTQLQVRRIQEGRNRYRHVLLIQLRNISNKGKLRLNNVLGCLENFYLAAKNVYVPPPSLTLNHLSHHRNIPSEEIQQKSQMYLYDVLQGSPSLPLRSKSTDVTTAQLTKLLDHELSYNSMIENIPIYMNNHKLMPNPSNYSPWQWSLLLNKCISSLPQGIFELVMDFMPLPRVWQWSLLRIKRRCKLAPHQAVLDICKFMDEILCDSIIFLDPEQKNLMLKISKSPQIHKILIEKFDMHPTLLDMLCNYGCIQGLLLKNTESDINFKYSFAKEMLNGAVSLYRWFRTRLSGLKQFDLTPTVGHSTKLGLCYGPDGNLMNHSDITDDVINMIDINNNHNNEIIDEEVSDYDIDLVNAIDQDTENEMIIDDVEGDESDSENENNNVVNDPIQQHH